MMEKIKNFYGSHPIRWTLLTLVVIIGLGLLFWYAPAFSMTASDVPVTERAPLEKGEQILYEVAAANGKAVRKGENVLIAEQAGRKLYLDTTEMILTLEDENGTTWSSAMPGATEGADKALLMLEFVGKNNAFTTFNSYTNGTQLYTTTVATDPETGEETGEKAFAYYDSIYRIENGVRIELRVLDNTKKLFAYMPRTMSKESYDFFQTRMAELEAAGEEVPYRTVFERYWRVDPSDPTKYPFQASGNSANVDADRQIIALAEQVGYTREMLLEDCAAYGNTAESPQLADFSVVMEITLTEEGELVVCIPTDEIVNHNEYFKLQRIHVLPNLCAEGASKESQGYFLVPDGAGALMSFNSSDGTIADILRPYMNNDYINDYYWQTEYAQELMMPIFGVMYGGAESTHGMLAIIEEGAETANLHVSLATPTTGKNKAYVSVDTLEHSWVRIYGAYADNTASYLADSGHIEMDFTVRYIPYESAVTYYDMAMDYRDYLAETSGKIVETPEGPGLYLELLGAVTLTERFVGVPYNATNSMTTYADALEIVKTLADYGVTYQYDGVFNGGVLSSLNDGAELVKENGSEEELAALMDAVEESGSEIFLQMNLSRVYENGRSYIPTLHAMRDYSNSPMTVYLYRADTARMNGRWDPIQEYTIVSPRFFSYLSEKIKADLNDTDVLSSAKLAIGDLAHDVYADYRYNDVIDPVEGRAYALEAINTLAAGDTALSLSDPFGDVAANGDYAVNISRDSSNYGSYYATVPFRQLALTGLTTVVSPDVNLSSRSLNHQLLQAAELGVSLKYTVSYQNPDVLKSSHFESYYAIYWESWQEEIISAAQALDALREEIGGRAIVNHELLAPQVFRTTYEGDVVVVTNYSALPYESTEGTVAPGTYLLVAPAQEGGAL